MSKDLTLSPEERSEQAETLQAIRRPGTRAKNARSFLSVCTEIVERGQFMRHKGRMIDHFSASAFVTVHKALKPDARLKLEEIAERSPLNALSICFKLCK